MPTLPPFIAPLRFTDASAALAQVQHIYDTSIAHLRDAMQRYVAGDDQAMSASAVRGFGVFAGPVARCAECHAGPMFTDDGFHNVGVAQSRGIEVDHGRATDLAKLARDPFNGAGPHAASAVPLRSKPKAATTISPLVNSTVRPCVPPVTFSTATTCTRAIASPR